MNKIQILPILLLMSFSLIIGCEKDEPEVPNEEEVITTLTYTLVPDDGSGTVQLIFQDLDGDGGNAPMITTSNLSANTTYAGALSLLNETESPAESISAEVFEEADEHQFFFSSTVSGLVVSYTDQDANGNPLGLATRVSTGASGTGTLTITLRHEPNKTDADVQSGNITNAGGETDIEVTFDINVQ